MKLNQKWGRYLLAVSIVFFGYFYLWPVKQPETMEWGVTFAKRQAESFGLDWKETYLAILDDLRVEHLRLSVYWDEIQPADDKFDFSGLDFQIQEARKRDVKIILALGRRLPRWPECHEPQWVQNQKLNTKNQKLLEYIEEIILRYRKVEEIWAWQVENEYFLREFGECPPADPKSLDQEINLVRSLDSRPIVLTDSGELGGWIGSIRRADIFGTTMYRTVYNSKLGYATYPLAPMYYLRRFQLFKFLGRAKKIINLELQAEPWSPLNNLALESKATWDKSLSFEKFQENLTYAKASGITPAYLWGAEWWYYVKKIRGNPKLWDEAKKLWAQ